MLNRHTALICALAAALSASGCEELGPDARGEVNTTALQRVGVDRECVPLFDVANVQGKGDLEFALRDGTRWRNTLSSLNPADDTDVSACTFDKHSYSFLFQTADAGEICASDLVMVGVRAHQLSRYVGQCRLGRFSRI